MRNLPSLLLFQALLGGVAATAAVAGPGAPAVLSSLPGQGRMTYRVVHKMHEVEGASTQLEAKAALLPDGTAKIMGRVPVASFVSGDGNRDAHMRETLEVSRYPWAIFRAVATVARPPGAGRVRAVLAGELELHGIRHPLEIPVEIEFSADGAARATATFDVSLEAFDIERPSLLFVKVDDNVRIRADIPMALEAAAPAAPAGARTP